MLCSICTNFDVRELLLKAEAQEPRSFNDPSAPHNLECLRPAVPHFFSQQPDLLSLRSSASGCDLCSCIWQSYAGSAHPNDLADEALRSGVSAGRIYIGTTGWDATLNGLPHIAVIQDGDRGAVRTLASFEVCALRGREPMDHQHLLAKSIYNSSGSEECLQLAASLLRDCLDNHRSCSSCYPISSILPTRIIDVEAVNPKLVDGNGRHETFTALSYCWGGDSHFILTSATEQALREGCPLDQFPATLRDAINVTKALGIRYIWIDALCIFQDSTQDWAEEASRMREVYSGAVVTIAAASASKTTEGIFRDRMILAHPRCWLDWRNGHKTKPRVFLRPGSELWDERMHQSSLNTRGWVLQETLLAPRTLWFGHQQLCFECPKGSVDEAGRTIRIMDMYRSKEFVQRLRERPLSGWKRRLLPILRDLHVPLAMLIPTLSLTNIIRARDLFTIRHRAIVHTPLTLQGYFKPPAENSGLSHFDYWIKIIENYSSRHLSKKTDTLRALSGLAEEFHRATGDTYVAGLWKLDIVRGLSWTREPVRRKRPNGYVEDEPTVSGVYLAPSWSWASILGRTVLFMANNQFDHVKLFAEVLDIDIQLATHDPFGAVNGGSITLRAPIVELDSQNLLDDPPPSTPYPTLLTKIASKIKYGGNSEYGQKHRGYVGQKYAILQLIGWRRAITGTSDNMCFLVLESVEGNESWRRIEVLYFTVRHDVFGDGKDVVQAQAILSEIKPTIRKKVVKII
ncbi:HET-domain-containing protein [Hypoxylon sp. NC1633]|nr:HET-domain-containing protein [Hypoxylon sp. NC1633]